MLKRYSGLVRLCITVYVVIGLAACSDNSSESPKGNIHKSKPDIAPLSNKAVLLKYKFLSGSKVSARYQSIGLNIIAGSPSQAKEDKTRTEINASIHYKVSTVGKNDIANIEFKIMQVSVSVFEADRILSYDSDSGDTNDHAAFLAFDPIIDTVIKLKVNLNGRILSRDMSSIKKKAKEKGATHLYKNSVKLANKFINAAFIRLPLKKVKAGDVIDMGILSSVVNEFDGIKHKLGYRISAVSDNGRLVLLEPQSIFNVPVQPARKDKAKKTVKKSNPEYAAKVGKDRQKKWVLFDLEKGYVKRSSSAMKLQLDVSMSNPATETLEISSDIQTLYQINE